MQPADAIFSTLQSTMMSYSLLCYDVCDEQCVPCMAEAGCVTQKNAQYFEVIDIIICPQPCVIICIIKCQCEMDLFPRLSFL